MKEKKNERKKERKKDSFFTFHRVAHELPNHFIVNNIICILRNEDMVEGIRQNRAVLGRLGSEVSLSTLCHKLILCEGLGVPFPCEDFMGIAIISDHGTNADTDFDRVNTATARERKRRRRLVIILLLGVLSKGFW